MRICRIVLVVCTVGCLVTALARTHSRGWFLPMYSGATCRSVTGLPWTAGSSWFVRNPPELAVEQVPGAVNIPLPQLRARLGELPHDREILVIYRSAQRAYYATRILLQNEFEARNISGGPLSRSMLVAK